MLEQGATYGTQDAQIWAPYYTLHKILAGLLDCYEVGGIAFKPFYETYGRYSVYLNVTLK